MSKETIINNFNWKIAGAAGDGILNAGRMLASTCQRAGLYVFASAEYPSLIRGGHNHLDIRISGEDIHSQSKIVDLLVALNKESIDKHIRKIRTGGGVIYDGERVKMSLDTYERKDVHFFDIPLGKLAKEAGNPIMRNVVAMGATVALTDFDLDLLNGVLEKNFNRKGKEIVDGNIKAAKLGYDFIKKNYDGKFNYKLEEIPLEKARIFMSGNESIVAGAIKAGCKFLSAYPMTPASSIMVVMAKQERNYNLVVKHTEDELAAINMTIGASHAGVRAMTATSGGGFCLMSEGLGLAIQTETPLVVVEAMRPGPGTGMATHSGQGDLKFVISASTDEGPRIVMAPGDVNEFFYKTIDAFNLAEKYQMPVIIMTDKYMAESYRTVEEFDTSNINVERYSFVKDADLEGYLRYKNTDSGVSARSVPGQRGGAFCASSYEHDEEGFEREEEEIRVMMHNKRFRKFENAAKELPDPIMYGNEDGEVTLIGWGSTKGPILEAIKILEKEGVKTNFLHVIYISPLPEKRISRKFYTTSSGTDKNSLRQKAEKEEEEMLLLPPQQGRRPDFVKRANQERKKS